MCVFKLSQIAATVVVACAAMLPVAAATKMVLKVREGRVVVLGQQGAADADVDWVRNRVDEAWTRALKFLVDGHPAAVRFEKDGVLDPAYQFNSYPAKTGAAMIEARVLAAREFPDQARRHLDVARKLVDVLIGMAPDEGRPLAHWVPTYRFHAECGERNPGLVCRRNEGLTMSRYPIDCAIAYLHLYQATRERRYLDEAVGVAETYRRLQGDDGTWPLKGNQRVRNRWRTGWRK